MLIRHAKHSVYEERCAIRVESTKKILKSSLMLTERQITTQQARLKIDFLLATLCKVTGKIA